MKFDTDYRYSGRETKAEYVWNKYEPILRGMKVLDVGADQCHLKRHLTSDSEYLGIGFGDVDLVVDLEKAELPFPDSSFDTVLCLDVLEHLEHIHAVFDELCRVTRGHVIISLPNPWSHFYKKLRWGHSLTYDPLKFYGLPLEPPEDRHRWFFSCEEAENFIRYRGQRNGMEIVQMDNEAKVLRGEGAGIKGFVRRLAKRILIRNPVADINLYGGTIWAALSKASNPG